MSYHDEEFIYDDTSTYDVNFTNWFRIVNRERRNYSNQNTAMNMVTKYQKNVQMEEKMGALKAYMNDIHDSCVDIGVTATAEKFKISQQEVKNTTMVWAGHDGTWEDFVSYSPDDFKE